MVLITGQEDPGDIVKTRNAIPADPTKTLKVIAAGYDRTGTVSFSMAMQILLKGPVCHSGSVWRSPTFLFLTMSRFSGINRDSIPVNIPTLQIQLHFKENDTESKVV